MSNSDNVDRLVLVVHGVGDPEPGETLSLFARSLGSQATPLHEYQEVVWLPDDSQSERHIKTFPMHMRKLGHDDKQTLLAEVFWGDLSEVRHGKLGAVRGLFDLVFGLRYAAHQAADLDGRAAKNVQRLGSLASSLLQGPVAAWNVILVVLMAVAIVLQYSCEECYRQAQPANVGIFVAGILCLVVVVIAWRCLQNRVFRVFLMWLTLSSLVLVGTGLGNLLTGGAKSGLMWYGEKFVYVLGGLWTIMSLVIALLIISWIPAVLKKDPPRDSMNAAVVLPALAAGIWGLVIPAFWLVAEQALQKFATVEEFDSLFKQAVPLLGLQMILAAILTIVTLFVVGCYFIYGKTKTVDDYKTQKPPRLIVHVLIQITVVIAAIVGIGTIMVLAILDAQGENPLEHPVGKYLTQWHQIAIGALVLATGVIFSLMPYLRSALDIVLDVVNHFYFVMKEGHPQFVRREAINQRLVSILRYFTNQVSGAKRLTIVSHSQGSMIAIDVLNHSDLDAYFEGFEKVDLVTMGSPFQHLYQHFYRHKYPPLSDAQHWSKLANRISQWVNVFRIDDFVGTEITGEGIPHCDNKPLPAGGHTYYWTDQTAIDVLRETMFSDLH